jgi:hypothetical protein
MAGRRELGRWWWPRCRRMKRPLITALATERVGCGSGDGGGEKLGRECPRVAAGMPGRRRAGGGGGGK